MIVRAQPARSSKFQTSTRLIAELSSNTKVEEKIQSKGYPLTPQQVDVLEEFFFYI